MVFRSRQAIFSNWEKLALWVAGILLVFGVATLVQHAGLQNAQRRLDARLDLIYQEISEHLGSGDIVLNSLVSLYQASDELSSTELTSISQELLAEYPYVSSVAFLTLVRAEDRASFEQSMRREGYMNFRIRSGESGNDPEPMELPRSRYMPVSFLEPLTPDTVRFVGRDLLTDAKLRGTLRQAVDSGGRAMTVSGLLSGGKTEYLLVRATYFGHFRPEDAKSRHEQLSGAFALTLDVESILNSLQSRYPDTGILLRPVNPGQEYEAPQFESERWVTISRSSGMLPTLSSSKRIRIHDIDIKLETRSQASLSDLSLIFSSVIMTLALVVSLFFFLSLRHQRIARITEHRSQSRILHERKRAEVTLASISDGVITTDDADRIQYMNPVAEQLTGLLGSEVRGRHIDEVINLQDENTKWSVRDITQRSGAAPFEKGNNLLLLRHDGRAISVHHRVSPLRDRDGTEWGAAIVIRDVSRERELERELSYQASHDSLTGLFNRRMFEHRLLRLVGSVKGEEHALCYMDLDQFKVINDTCGHLAGDELLRQLGRMLMKQVRKRDTIARLGGDEFGVLIEHCTLDEARAVAEDLRIAVEEFRFVFDAKSFNLGVSIGLVPIDASSTGIADVLSAADGACYTAKEKGRNRIHVFRYDDTELKRRHTEMKWVVEIQRAIEEKRMTLWYQPIVPVADGALHGHYELLLRMIDERGNMIPPGAFLPTVERYDLSDKVDRWVVETAFQWLVNHPRELGSPTVCCINLSGNSLDDDAFLNFVFQSLRRFRMPPGKICFEVTETAAVANLSTATNFISKLRKQGCLFALDDFGTGLSSFAYLKSLPVDFLKIDGMFVRDIANNPIDRAMVRSVNEIGHVMGKKTIAEFVKNDETLTVLRKIGVDYAQGYGIGRPRPIEDFSYRKRRGPEPAPLPRAASGSD
jgi:diguanylate cyclase (GGDEF)-like protein/PAS domain S-box-containing protein